MGCPDSTGASAPRNPHRPSAGDIDASIALSLERFESTPRAVRDAGAALLTIVYRLPVSRVLDLIAAAHRFDIETRRRT